MTFRVEEKTILSFGSLHDFNYWLKEKKAKKIYPLRNIRSLYFDNFSNDMFVDSEEGLVPRKKIRIRNYPNSKNNSYSLETKISSIEGRFKVSKIIDNEKYQNYLDKGIVDNIYGFVFPKVLVNYDREYYLLNGSRITLDKNIKYSSYISKYSYYNENNYVIEIKENNNLNKELKNFFPFQRARFSKYCRAILKLNICR